MDKLLFAAFFSAFAAFITAVISIVKMVVEKENKTSEFRQSWTNSVRTSISDLAAKLTSMSSGMEYQRRLGLIENRLSKKSGGIYEKRLEMVRASLLRVREEISEARHDQYQTYALCKLHFKPDDPVFKPIEKIFNDIVDGYTKIKEAKDDVERKDFKKKNYELIQEMVEVGRKILKEEWERVKDGEKAYKTTKKYSLYGGEVALAIFVLIGGYFFIQSITAPKSTAIKTVKSDNERVIENKTDKYKCWQLQNFGKRIFKMNSCTGELIELTKVKSSS